MLGWLKKLFTPVEYIQKAPSAVMGAPKIVAEVIQKVGPSDPAEVVTPLRVQHAVSRLDAIYRTVSQVGKTLSKAHLEEFRTETREHVHTLVAANLLTDRQGLAIVEANVGLKMGSVK